VQFVDEAYCLKVDSEKDYGKETFETLMEAMLLGNPSQTEASDIEEPIVRHSTPLSGVAEQLPETDSEDSEVNVKEKEIDKHKANQSQPHSLQMMTSNK